MHEKLNAVITTLKMITPQICQFELRHPDGRVLPPFKAGAHINVDTPAGVTRSYSLINDEIENDRYVIAVKREHEGRGGSISMHTATAQGDVLRISTPSNAFQLYDAAKYLLVAGGIGITPILSMFRKLVRQGHRDVRLIYCTRSAEATPYLNELTAPGVRDLVTIHHGSYSAGTRFDFWPFLRAPTGQQLYYCGPSALMVTLYAQTIHWPRSAVHNEDFGGVSIVGVDSKPFKVRRAATDEILEIPADRSIIEVFRDAGLKPNCSCESGTCGTCRVRLVSGEPDHRDLVLTQEERVQFFMPCVSRAVGDEITLEI
jgi:phthalate 4,5-dioxygenase reductase component